MLIVSILIGPSAFQQVVSEQVISLLVQDNLDIACSAIEKTAMERAVTDVDEGFAASYEVRRRHREVRYFTFKLFFFFVLMEFDDLASQYAAVLGSIRSAFQFYCDYA